MNLSKYTIQIGWEDVPHLSPEAREELLSEIPMYQRAARSKGTPMLGSGAIYQIDEERLRCAPIEIPAWWPKAFALDPGWNRTAAIWGAWDQQTDTVYLWSEHYMGQAPPQVHADAIKARDGGTGWMPGVIDPAGRGSSQIDGKKFMEEYAKLGLNLMAADNSVEAGIFAVERRMQRGGLKVFSTLANFWAEFRVYRRDTDGKIVKEFDHIMDAVRYLIMSGMARALAAPPEDRADEWDAATMTANSRTGY